VLGGKSKEQFLPADEDYQVTSCVLQYADIQTKAVSSPLTLKWMYLYLAAFHDEPKIATYRKMYSTQSLN